MLPAIRNIECHQAVSPAADPEHTECWWTERAAAVSLIFLSGMLLKGIEGKNHICEESSAVQCSQSAWSYYAGASLCLLSGMLLQRGN